MGRKKSTLPPEEVLQKKKEAKRIANAKYFEKNKDKLVKKMIDYNKKRAAEYKELKQKAREAEKSLNEKNELNK